MTASAQRALTALGMFVLIAVVVLGGMTWATVVSFELAKKNIAEEHQTRVTRALSRIESQVVGVLNSEASRAYTDYVDYYVVRPESVFFRDGRELAADFAILRSPLAMSKPPFEWIDLYFQVDHKGKLSSPQLDEDNPRSSSPASAAVESAQRRALEAWVWFKRVEPVLDFRARVTEVLQRDEFLGIGAEPEPTRVVRVAQRAPGVRPGGRSDSFSRRSSPAFSQSRYLPPEACVLADIAAHNIENQPVAIDSGSEDTGAAPSQVRVAPGPFAPPFWIDAVPPGYGRKLAFVRECHADAQVIYQGFVGDWERLKPELLRIIDDDFPQADLEPVPNEVELDDDASALKLHALPALLKVPDISGGTTAAAWKSLWGVLAISWTAAIAVLVTAAWGVGNLVSLTERRLQFAYAVTHELRTPLTTFRLYSDMLSAGLVPDEGKQEYLDTLNRESQRLSTLVEAVLEYARLENQKVKLHLALTDAASLLRAVGETLEKRCEKNGVQAQTRSVVPEAYPLRTDVNLVNQITAVLVDNACRHARSSKSPTVRLELGGENARLHLDVMDSGPGVEMADSRRIFKPFRRGKDADTAARGGIGLGLALARNWANLLGGRLDLVARHHPELGGAHFRLTIPSVTQS